MMWKNIIISILLNINTKVMSYMINDYKSYSDFLSLSKRDRVINCISGNDYRHSINKTSDNEIIAKMIKNNHQMELLNKLESKTISQSNKLNLIEQYNKDYGVNLMVSNIKNGGLYKDWNS